MPSTIPLCALFFICSLAVSSMEAVAVSPVLGQQDGGLPRRNELVKTMWPEVVGLEVEDAKKIIQGDVSYGLHFQLINKGNAVIWDYNPARVRIFVDPSKAKVIQPPPFLG